MEKLLEQMALQSPGIVACILIVIFFLRHMKEISRETGKLFKDMHAEHIDARAQSRDVLKDNTQAAKENTIAINRLAISVENMKFRSGIGGE